MEVNVMAQEKETLFVTRKKLIMIITALFLVIFLAWGYAWANKTVTITVDGKTTRLKTMAFTVEKAITKAGITLQKEDLVTPSLKTELKEGMRIKITRALPVKIIADGREINVKTPLPTVEALLKAQKISLGDKDKIIPSIDAKIFRNLEIKIIRVTEKIEIKEFPIAYKVETKKDKNLEKGQKKVLQEGQNGLGQKTIKITYEDGQEVKREVIGQKILKAAVNKVIALGTLVRVTLPPSRGGELRNARLLGEKWKITAYTHTGRNTASGQPPRYGVAAAPPSIPIGTRLFIEGYGEAIVLDRGSDVQGNHIDVFFDSISEARSWGTRYKDVYIIDN